METIRLVLFVLPIVSQCCLQADQLVTALHFIRASILRSHPYCSALNVLIESNLGSSFKADLLRGIPQDTDLNEHATAVALIMDLGLGANTNESPIQFHFENGYTYRHHQPCTGVLFEISDELLSNVAFLNNGTIGARWTERIIPLLPNDVFRTFITFFTTNCLCAELESQITEFMHETGMFLHSVFVIPAESGEILIFDGLPKSSQGLRQVVKIDDKGKLGISTVFRNDYDYQGEPVMTIFCSVCAPTPEEIEQTSPPLGNSFRLAWILLQKDFNMTPEIEHVFGIPTAGINEEGEYDDFVLPVLEGVAAITFVMIPTNETDHILFHSFPYWYDTYGFLTGRPKTVVSGGIYMMAEPLNLVAWVVLIATSTCIIAIIEVLLYAEEPAQLLGIGIHLWLVEIVLKPLISQPGYEEREMRKRVRIYSVNFILGIWGLSLIVLQCLYNSALLGIIAFPRLIFPPQTFRQLAESDYEIGGIFAEAVTHDLRATGIWSNLILAERLVPHDFIDSTCYQSVLEREMACLGLVSLFDTVGVNFNVDVYGRKIVLGPQDPHFLTFGAAGVSKYFPMFLGAANRYISLLDSIGISNLADRVGKQRGQKIGIKYARENVAKKRYYAGDHDDPAQELQKINLKVIGVVTEILFIGFSISIIALVCEFVSSCLSNRKVRAAAGHANWELDTPQIYVQEFASGKLGLSQ